MKERRELSLKIQTTVPRLRRFLLFAPASHGDVVGYLVFAPTALEPLVVSRDRHNEKQGEEQFCSRP
jgi:hypothetical protein